jgi:hypothetical protein
VFVQDVTGIEHLRAERDRLLQFAAVHEVLPSLLHELKTPLASVLSSVELLVEDTPEGPMQAALYAVLLELRRMKLNMEGIGSVGRPLRSNRAYPIDDAVTQACHVLEANARGRGVTLRCEVALLPLLPFDPSVVRAVVFNLVTNALYACRVGDEIEVSLGLDPAGAQLVLSVRRHGVWHEPGDPCPLSRPVLHHTLQRLWPGPGPLRRRGAGGAGLAHGRVRAFSGHHGDPLRSPLRSPLGSPRRARGLIVQPH